MDAFAVDLLFLIHYVAPVNKYNHPVIHFHRSSIQHVQLTNDSRMNTTALITRSRSQSQWARRRSEELS
jgi:hypothetical protein